MLMDGRRRPQCAIHFRKRCWYNIESSKGSKKFVVLVICDVMLSFLLLKGIEVLVAVIITEIAFVAIIAVNLLVVKSPGDQ